MAKQYQRSLLQRIVRGALRALFAGRMVVRRLPAEFGGVSFFVSPESQLKYLKPGIGSLDPMLLGFARDHVKPGGVVWDVGANVGVFTFAAAGRGASVVAVEPDPFLANGLLRSKRRNPHLDIKVLAAALSATAGVAELAIASGGRAANSLIEFAGTHTTFGDTLARLYVPTLPLDGLLALGRPDFVKIDVEGAELLVLQGASVVLNTVRPIIAIEVSSAVAEPVSKILLAAGYRLFDAETGAGPLDAASFNTLALPS